MFDITALGELLIDFCYVSDSTDSAPMYRANPGGAPCNVLAEMSRLGKKTAFIGKVGDDTFGKYLKKQLEDNCINTDFLSFASDAFTTLAFVSLDKSGNREFSFSRNHSADTLLSSDEVNKQQIANSRLFHIGTLSLTDEPAKSATLAALEYAKKSGICISADPNLRLPLWKIADDAKCAMQLVLKSADIIKISDCELEFLYTEKNIITAAELLISDCKPKILFVTCGKSGAYMFKDGQAFYSSSFDVKTVDTTGAGDCFFGAALSRLLDLNLDFEKIGSAECMDIIKYANAAASLSTTKYGAIPAMPSSEDIEKLLRQ